MRVLFSAQERWLALPCVVVLAGCAAFEPKPLVPAQTAGKFEARTLADPGLQTFVEVNAPELAKEWPRRSWDLRGLTVVAFYYHPSLDVARAQWGVANAGVKTAAGRPNPTLSITPGYNFSAASLAAGELEHALQIPFKAPSVAQPQRDTGDT